MEFGSVTSLGSLVLAALVTFLGGFRYVSAQNESLRREIMSAQDQARLLIEKASESESKQRHTMASSLQLMLAKQEGELRDLQRTTVRHEQMDALEIRLNVSLSKLEIKVDRLGEQMQEIIAIRTKLEAVLNMMSRINDRLDEDNGTRKNTRLPA